MKNLVIGSSGLVGSYLCKELLDSKKNKVIGTYNENEFELNDENFTSIKLDALDFKTTKSLVKAISPEIIYITASLTNVNYCEENILESQKANFESVANIAKVAQEINALVVFFSTDYVFGEGDHKKTINDYPKPLNAYGLHKLFAEHFISTFCDKWIIIRTSSVFGCHPGYKNFPARILKAIQNKDKEFEASENQIDTPTYAKHLANFAVCTAKFNDSRNKVSELFHYSNNEQISRKDFGKRILDRIAPAIPGFHTLHFVEPKISKKQIVAIRPKGGLEPSNDITHFTLDRAIADFRDDFVKFLGEQSEGNSSSRRVGDKT